MSLSEDSMKQFGLSADFQILLTKTIEDLVYHLEDTDQVHLGYYTIIIICVFIVLMT